MKYVLLEYLLPGEHPGLHLHLQLTIDKPDRNQFVPSNMSKQTEPNDLT